MSCYLNNKSSKLFDGRSLALGGSKQITPFDDNQMIFTGDISAILLKNLPIWASLSRTPPLEIALMPEWEEKLKLMAKITSKQNITSLGGSNLDNCFNKGGFKTYRRKKYFRGMA